MRVNIKKSLFIEAPKPSSATQLNKKPLEDSRISELQSRSNSTTSSDLLPVQPNLWEGEERRAAHLVVAKERRIGYFISSPLGPEAQRKRTMLTVAQWQELPFEEARKIWLEQKNVQESTKACYSDYLDRLELAFAGMKLKQIHIGHLHDYQVRNKPKYHPASVNHDLNTLLQILERAGMRRDIEEQYEPLYVPESPLPKVLSEREEDGFFELAASDPSWWFAYWVASLTNNTTASGKELRMMRLEDVDLEDSPPRIYIHDSKNKHRTRVIPLNERGRIIIERVLQRARKCGSTRPEHYVFPFRVKRNFWDPNRPPSESWIKYRWKLLVEAAIQKEIINFHITPHNLRHNGITNLLEAGIPPETVRAIAGHVTEKIMRHYHHARIETMHRAVNAVDPERKRPRAEISTNGRTKGVSA